MKTALSILLSFAFLFGNAQEKKAYQIFTAKGKKASFGKMMKALQEKDIILFGEFHNNAIAHWLQLEVTKEMGDKQPIVLGAEMFEADNQTALNKYLAGEITAKGFDSSARLWKNYPTDYAPLVDYAKEKKFGFIATNIPRRYASTVSKEGFEALDTLPAEQKNWIAPLPPAYDSTLPGYVNMMKMMGGHASSNFPKAQAIKDATMAHFILQNFQPSKPFIHFNGAYHSDNYEGILWYLKKQKPDLRYATISTMSQKELAKLLDENKGKADFIIVVDEDMTNTY